MASPDSTHLLPPELEPGSRIRSRLEEDYRRLADRELEVPLDEHALSAYSIDLRARFGSLSIPHPFGKASGQLSLDPEQVRADARAGLAFTVLKTVIAESPGGASRMGEWKVEASRMALEKILSRSGKWGWTVSWIGRGWEGTLAAYATLLSRSLQAAREGGLVVVASAKFHLPAVGEAYESGEYRHTLAVLADAWRDGGGEGPLLLEKDFSPTLAGSELARDDARILEWVDEVPRLVRRHASGRVSLGLKLMNSLFPDETQLEMLRRAARADPPLDFITCFNRLFDPERTADGRRGIAYGGHDLSDRNLRVLGAFAREGGKAPISATGNIASGRLMAEYALRGATSGQIHTFFQLPRASYVSRRPRSAAALHELVFHPHEGLLAGLAHLRGRVIGKPDSEVIRFLDLPRLGRDLTHLG